MIIASTPSKPFMYTAKNTARRQAILSTYEAEINALYVAVDETTQSDLIAALQRANVPVYYPWPLGTPSIPGIPSPARDQMGNVANEERWSKHFKAKNVYNRERRKRNKDNRQAKTGHRNNARSRRRIETSSEEEDRFGRPQHSTRADDSPWHSAPRRDHRRKWLLVIWKDRKAG